MSPWHQAGLLITYAVCLSGAPLTLWLAGHKGWLNPKVSQRNEEED